MSCSFVMCQGKGDCYAMTWHSKYILQGCTYVHEQVRTVRCRSLHWTRQRYFPQPHRGVQRCIGVPRECVLPMCSLRVCCNPCLAAHASRLRCMAMKTLGNEDVDQRGVASNLVVLQLLLVACPLRKSPNISSPVYCYIVTRHEGPFIVEAVCLCA